MMRLCCPRGEGRPGRVSPTVRLLDTRDGAGADAWVNVHVDLTALAGEQVYLELLNACVGALHSEAYWGSVRLESK